MSHDHVAIGALTDAMANTDPSEADALQELLYGVRALITVPFRREEDLLPDPGCRAARSDGGLSRRMKAASAISRSE
jgi:hypothetical protein